MPVNRFSKMVFSICLLGGLACQPKDASIAEQADVTEAAPAVTEVAAVNIWEGASFREEPKSDGSWLSSLALGEKVTFLGEAVTDSADNGREFYRLRLSDGREGWSLAYVIVADAEPAALIETSSVYRRPDLLTVTDDQFHPLDVVAVTGREGDWLEVVGNRREKSGWIKNSSITTEDVDIAVATLATNAIAEEDSTERQVKLEAIVNNSAFSSSIFMSDVRELMANLKVQGDPTP